MLNLISRLGRHCLQPLCGPSWAGGLARPVIVEGFVIEARDDGHFHDIDEAGPLPKLCLTVRPDQWTRYDIVPDSSKSLVEHRANIEEHLKSGKAPAEVERPTCDYTARPRHPPHLGH